MQIMVLAMHRSGSSVLARLLNMMGAYFAPEDKIMYPALDNPKGFWERTDVVQLNDRILQAGGGTWDNVLDFDWSRLTPDQVQEFTGEITRLVAALDANRPWMVKDPRLCITFPLWKGQLEVPVCIHAYRNPLQIARSLQRRNSIPLTVGVALWEAYLITALNNSRGLPNILVAQEEIMGDPLTATQRLKEELEAQGVHGLRAPTEKELNAFIDQRLLHHGESEREMERFLNGRQLELWLALKTGNPFDLEAPLALSAGAQDAYRSYLDLHQELAAGSDLSSDLKRNIADLEGRIAELTALCEAGSGEMARLRADLHEQRAGFERRQAEAIGIFMARQALVEELGRNIEATFMSWRWKVGHYAVKMVESLLGRKNVILAKHRIEQIIRELGRGSELEALRAQIAEITGVEGKAWSIGGRKEEYTRERQDELARFLDSDQELTVWGGGRPRVSIILVLFNRAELTFACLKSIREIVDPAIEVVIVDNASSDRTGELLERVKGGVKIIRNTENLNFLKGCNQAAPHCEGEYILFLNNDAILLPNALNNALKVFREEPAVGAVGGKIILLDGTLQEAGSIIWQDGSCYGYGRGGNPTAPEFMFRRSVDYCSGAFLLVRREIHTALGGFDEDYAPAYYEETDFCLRLRRQGLEVVYEPSVQILHYEFGSSEISERAIALQRKHRHTLVAKHADYLATRRPPDLAHALEARYAERQPHVLYIDDRIPHVKYGSGFPRSNFMLKSLAERYAVTLFPLNFPDEEAWGTVYTDIPKRVEVIKSSGRAGFARFLKERKGYYDAVLVSRPHNMEFYADAHRQVYGRQSGPAVIYDAEALFALRDAVKAQVLGGITIDRAKEIKNEVALTRSAARVIAVSESEREIFLSEGVPAVDMVGHAMSLRPTATPFAERQGILFIGNMDNDHSPNVDSVFWFLEQVFEAVRREVPDLELVLVGSNKSKKLREINHPAVRVVGPVDDLTPYYEACRIFIAPARFAAGMPYKVHEAASRGIPVVCSGLIREQLGWSEGDVLATEIADPAAFARQCVRLYTELVLWEAVRDRALRRIEEECSEKHVKEELLGIFEQVLAGRG